MIIEAKGRKVIVRDGPAKTTHLFDNEDDALDFAAEKEEERLARMEADMAKLLRYSDPDHPADPVLPRPGDLLRRLAEIHNAENPDDLVEVPPADVSDESEEVLREQTLALLDQLRNGGEFYFADAEPSTEGTEGEETDETGEGAEEPDEDAEEAWTVLAGLITFEFDYDEAGSRLKAVMTSQATVPVTISREVTAAHGEVVRSGDTELPDGRVLSRHYDLQSDQSIRFCIGEHEIARFPSENTSEPDEVE